MKSGSPCPPAPALHRRDCLGLWNPHSGRTNHRCLLLGAPVGRAASALAEPLCGGVGVLSVLEAQSPAAQVTRTGVGRQPCGERDSAGGPCPGEEASEFCRERQSGDGGHLWFLREHSKWGKKKPGSPKFLRGKKWSCPGLKVKVASASRQLGSEMMEAHWGAPQGNVLPSVGGESLGCCGQVPRKALNSGSQLS